jgi:hypothetical protein
MTNVTQILGRMESGDAAAAEQGKDANGVK